MSLADAHRIAVETERVMLAACRRVRRQLPDEPDLHEHYRQLRAAVRNDPEYRAALHRWHEARQTLADGCQS